MSAGAPPVGPMIHLGTVAPFRDLSHNQLVAVALASEEVVYPADAWMLRAGEPLGAMLMIVDGYADLLREEGTRDTLGPGSLVGFPGILVPATAKAGVRARTDIVALRLGTDALRELCEQNFAILAALLSFIAERVASNPEAATRAAQGSPPRPEWEEGDDEVGRVARMLALRRAPMLPADSMDALAELAGRVEPHGVGADEEVWEDSRPAEGFWVVASGTVELTVQPGRPVEVGVGGVLGFCETFAGRPYTGRARAVRTTTLLHVPIDPFMDVIEDHFELAFALLGRLGRLLPEE